jgi:hypothetical protein
MVRNYKILMKDLYNKTFFRFLQTSSKEIKNNLIWKKNIQKNHKKSLFSLALLKKWLENSFFNIKKPDDIKRIFQWIWPHEADFFVPSVA